MELCAELQYFEDNQVSELSLKLLLQPMHGASK